jgi:hypothetical protein
MGCLDLTGGCANTKIAEVVSPDQSRNAVVFSRDCGATTSISLQLSIIPVNPKLPNEGGNVLVIATDRTASELRSHRSQEIEPSWVGPRRLLVRYALGAQTYQMAHSVDGVEIEYGGLVK